MRDRSSEWDRLPACHSSVDRLEAYPTCFPCGANRVLISVVHFKHPKTLDSQATA
ncbi:hypothetical protein Enr13x_15740 [Stieleria neptunia]|uniref:Uncharacterized protein n=1 Tax=Stieleria neptunia TaxID=2527979 RepID=A0A518HLJ9_9BACT|nr:hypothetical protein Enr13x_15740 [Stieleria neptunia]